MNFLENWIIPIIPIIPIIAIIATIGLGYIGLPLAAASAEALFNAGFRLRQVS